MPEAEQLLFFLNVAKKLNDLGENGFTLNIALKIIEDSCPGSAGKASRDLCGRQLLKVIQEVREEREKLIFDQGTKFLLTPAIKGILSEAIKSKLI